MRGFTGEQKDFDAVSKKIGPETYTAEAKSVDRLDNTAFDKVQFIVDNYDDILSASGIINYSTSVLFYRYIAIEGQTVFSGADVSGRELSVAGAPIVFVNYTENVSGTFSVNASGTEVTFDEPLHQNDVVMISAFTFSAEGGVVFDFQADTLQELLDSTLAASNAGSLAQQNAETANAAAQLAHSLADAARILAEAASTNATESATQAGTFSNSAAGYALAALNSETIAATQANLAQQSAATTTLDRQLAETARVGAESARTNAISAQQSAEISSGLAASSASNAAISENEAGQHASAAATHTSVAESYATASAQNSAATAQDLLSTETARGEAVIAQLNAAQSESNAAGSASLAETSAINASNSENAAGDSAVAAAGSATTAGTAASNAATSAAASQEAQTAAETAQAAAQTSESNASESETNSAGSAAAANTAATNAANSESAAAGSATAASNFASSAATQAGLAATSATAAQQAQLAAETAEATAIAAEVSSVISETNAAGSASSASSSATLSATVAAQLLPSDFQQDDFYFQSGSHGAPAPGGSALSGAFSFVDDAQEGRVVRVVNPTGTWQNLNTTGVVPGVSGRTYRLTVRARYTGAIVTSDGYHFAIPIGKLDGTYIQTGTQWLSQITLTDQWADYTQEWTPTGTMPAFWRPGLVLKNSVTGTGTIEISRFIFEDITESALSSASASASASSASIATTKADEAGVSAAAASASQVAAGNSAGNAAASEAASAGFASTAEGHSLAAQTSSEVAARFVSGSAVPNATFSDWDGTWPDNFLVIEGGSGNTVSKNTADAKYANAVRMEVGPTHVMLRPVLYSVTSINSGTWPITDTVKVTLELELISGDWTDVQIIGSWPAPAWNNVFKPLSPLLKPTVGLIQKIEILVEKPASVDVEDVTAIQIALYGTWASHAPKAFLVHSFNIEPVVAESIAAITKQVRADMDGIQAAAIGMRAVAGSAGAELELVAMDDPEGGPVSAARINADHILLEGTTRARHLFIDEALDIDESSGAFRMGKQSAVDLVNDGIYMGRTDDGGGALGFGFHAGRVSGGVEEYIQHTKSGGLRLKNATFLIGAGAATETVVLTNQTVSLVGKTSVSFTLMPGGGGGSSGYWADGAGGETGGNPGATGGTTTVVLKDGTTTIQTWTATGGTGGSGYGDGNGTQPANPSSQPPYGNGGTGGAGQGYHTYEGHTSFYRAGKSGNPGITVQASTIDLTPYSDPKLEITIGAAGAGGAGTAGFFGGGAGGAGRVDYAASTTEDFLAAPVGLSPSATGTFFVTAGVAGTFPVLSPSRGLWVLNNCPTNWRVTPGAGNTEIWASHGTVSFISPSTPTWSTNASTTNEVRYHFFPM